MVTPEKLEYGSGYSLVEVQAPYGYVLDSTPVYFDVTEDASSEEGGVTVIEVTKPNMAQKGVIKVSKTGEVFSTVTESNGVYQPVYDVTGLSGAVFEITALEDVYTLDGTLRYSAGEVVDTITTGEDGTAQSQPLYLGKFQVKEIEFPHGMVDTGENVTNVELVYAGQEVEITETSASFYNQRQKVQVTLNKLLEQDEAFSIGIALSLELFTTGSLDIFGRESTVDLDKRVVVFDIRGLGQQLKPTGLLVITDTILNRVTLNWKRGKRTHVFLDEFHVVFENEQSGVFFNSAWRQFRKRGAYPTAITQNVEYLLDSVQASTMLSNSEFIVMLNQAASDREKLAKLLNISKEQMSYVTNADAGCGLIRYGSALVPFINRFPRDKYRRARHEKRNENQSDDRWGGLLCRPFPFLRLYALPGIS